MLEYFIVKRGEGGEEENSSKTPLRSSMRSFLSPESVSGIDIG